MDTYKLLLVSNGGYQPKLCTGTNEVTLPDGCVAIRPNKGCIFTSIKRSDTGSDNHADATHMNLLTVDLGTGENEIKLIAKDGTTWSKLTMSAGTCYAICI